MSSLWRGRNRKVEGEESRSEELRVVATRRPSDFQSSPGGVSLYSGTCTCCCCCLHWVGALIGGGVGYSFGWKREKTRFVVQRYAHIGFTIGVVVSILSAIVAGIADIEWLQVVWAGPLLVAPFVFFIPPAIAVFLSAWASHRVSVPHQTQFVDRGEEVDPHGVYRAAAAEEQRSVDKEIYGYRTRSEFASLIRVGFFTVLFSLLGTAAAYVVMVLLFLVFAQG